MKNDGRFKPLTTELMVSKLSKKFPLMDFSESIYTSHKGDINFKCKKHGLVSRKYHLLVGSGISCLLCYKEDERERRRLKIIQAISIRNPYLKITNLDFQDSKSPVTFKCEKHGLHTTKVELLTKHGCPKCSSEYVSNKFSLGLNEFIERARKNHGDKYDYSNSIYRNLNSKIRIDCLIHGAFTVKARSHIDGSGCKKCEKDEALKVGYHERSNRFSFDKFKSKAISAHGNKYYYYQETYVKMKDKVKINCKDHGGFWQQASRHATGQNCPQCVTEGSRIKYNDFLSRSKNMHGGKYDYSKSVFNINRDRVIIICNFHGEFKQKVSAHLSGHGCRKCEAIGFKRSTFIIQCKEKSEGRAKLYLIKCSSKNETFFKVGITRTSVKLRFKNLPYDYHVLSIINSESSFIWDKEHEIHRELNTYHYEPLIAFGGHKLECFSTLTKEVMEFFGVSYDSIT